MTKQDQVGKSGRNAVQSGTRFAKLTNEDGWSIDANRQTGRKRLSRKGNFLFSDINSEACQTVAEQRYGVARSNWKKVQPQIRLARPDQLAEAMSGQHTQKLEATKEYRHLGADDQVFFISKGRVTITDPAGEQFEVDAGRLVLLPPHVQYDVKAKESAHLFYVGGLGRTGRTRQGLTMFHLTDCLAGSPRGPKAFQNHRTGEGWLTSPPPLAQHALFQLSYASPDEIISPFLRYPGIEQRVVCVSRLAELYLSDRELRS